MQAKVLIGVSASGKSTWAAKFIKEHPNFREINRDETRWRVSGKLGWNGPNAYRFDSKTELQVTEHNRWLIHYYFDNGNDIIISDTNLNPKFRKQLIQDLKLLGYDVEEIVFDISFQEAVKRDKDRGIFAVGEDVIKRQWEQYVKYYDEKNESEAS